MKKLILSMALLFGILATTSVYAQTCGRSSGGDGLCQTKQNYCQNVVRSFKRNLNSCWSGNSKGCVSHYTSHSQMSDAEFHGCKRRLYRACVRTCYRRWGQGDSGCNHHRSCGLFIKYL